ncbi:hypothetical protein [Stenotrophomonas sp. PS02298]|uniref:hypothetical protein n=1 Tax=Stenotrophomonas sp. PS02298 TaxID=2991424 RepID=UPI00249BC7D8|nr:hypothetical protein [Stenotrophomonas sp. PS02298]
MVTIRQHGSNGELFDISSFLTDIDRFVRPDTWTIVIDECMGDRAVEIQQLSSSDHTLADCAFRSLYHDIFQTIDGHFVVLSGGEPVLELLAVDSSFWEISGTPAFESHMLAKYGAWHRA